MNVTKTRCLFLFTAILAALGCVGLVAMATAAKPKDKTIQVSVKSNGKEAPAPADADFPRLSANGRFACFESLNKLTGAPDSGMDDDVFVHDRKTGKTVRASVTAKGKEPAGQADSDTCSLSGDGSEVAFVSDAKLIGSDNNNSDDVYVKNLKTGKLTLASVDASGNQLSGVSIDDPQISGNGRYVAWDSDGAFSPSDINAVADVYRNDLKTGKTVQVSLRNDGSQPDGSFGGESVEPSLSDDGNKVAFASDDGEMTADTDYENAIDRDVFVRDIKAGTTTRASLSSNGDEPEDAGMHPPSTANATSNHPVISGNGKFVAFTGEAVYNETDAEANYTDVFVHKMSSGKTTMLSVNSKGQQATGASGYTDPHPVEISADGRYVAYDSLAALSPADKDNVGDVYVRDTKTNKTALVTLKSKGKPLGHVDAALPALSADGNWVAWTSSDPYVKGDNNNGSDIFERGPLH